MRINLIRSLIIPLVLSFRPLFANAFSLEIEYKGHENYTSKEFEYLGKDLIYV